jgi:hypothetical protein
MKNIHILPTDRPSRLYKNDDVVGLHPIPTTLFPRIDIYITSDEEIKDGDWYFDENKLKVKRYFEKREAYPSLIHRFKIILTTDPDLIKDGVQAIDDEFLEWFVKNPSCEFIRVGLEIWNDGNHNPIIIIPKEELHSMDDEVECNMCGGYMYLLPDNSIYVCTNSECTRCYEEEDEEPTLANMRCTCMSFDPNCFTGSCRKCGFPPEEKPKLTNTINKDELGIPKGNLTSLIGVNKQETLEEAAKNNAVNNWLCGYNHLKLSDFDKNSIAVDFGNGWDMAIKWQQEQDKKMYSEEEVLEILNHHTSYLESFIYQYIDKDDMEENEEWFKQFKKK